MVRIIARYLSKRSPLPSSTSAQRGRCGRVADCVGAQCGRRAGGGDVEQLLRPFVAGTLPQGRWGRNQSEEENPQKRCHVDNMPSRKLLTFIDLIPRSPDSPKLSPILVHLLSTVTNTRDAPYKCFARHGGNVNRIKTSTHLMCKLFPISIKAKERICLNKFTPPNGSEIRMSHVLTLQLVQILWLTNDQHYNHPWYLYTAALFRPVKVHQKCANLQQNSWN